MTFDEWAKVGYDQGWCSPPVCCIHDGTPTSAYEDSAEVDDPCVHVVRLYPDMNAKLAVEDNSPHAVWRATNRGWSP